MVVRQPLELWKQLKSMTTGVVIGGRTGAGNYTVRDRYWRAKTCSSSAGFVTRDAREVERNET